MTNHASNYAVAASIGPRFLVAGVMLAIMGVWMSTNHDDPPFGPIGTVSALAAISLVWGLARMRVADDAAAADLCRRSGILALLGAIVLAAAGVWWAMTWKLAALGEILGLEVFAILSLFAAWQYLGSSQTQNWERIRASLGVISVAFLTIGAIAIGAFLFLAFAKEAPVDGPFGAPPDPKMARSLGADFLPEMIGMLMAGFMLFFGGLYLFTSRQSASEPETLCLFFLVVGVTLGGAVALVSLARGYLWSDELFRSGIADTLSGNNAWHFWVVAYEFVVGLGLILAALGAAFSPDGTSASLRRWSYGAGAFVSAALVFIGLTTAVMLVYLQAPYNFSWSKTRGVSALSPSTKNLLAGLEQPVHVYAIINPGTLIYEDLTHFLANCKVYSRKFDYEVINLEKSPEKFKPLATRFKELNPETMQEARDPVGRGVLVVYGSIPDDIKTPVPHAFIPSRQLFEQKGDMGKETLFLKAEVEITKEIAFLTNKSEKRKIYFLQGNDELDLFSADGSGTRVNTSISLGKFSDSKLVEKLKSDRFEVAAVSFGFAAGGDKGDKLDKKKDIVYLGGDGPNAKLDLPEDCNTLIIVGPSLPLPQTGLDALERYMDRGGRLIVYLDVFTDVGFTKWKDTGLETFLKKYGVDVTQEIVLRFPQQQEIGAFGNAWQEPFVVLAETPTNAKSLLAKQFQDHPLEAWSARVIKPGTSSKYQVEPLLVVNGNRSVVWADDNPRGLANLPRYVFELFQSKKLHGMVTRDSLPIAVTVSEGAKPRMVVFGDSEFVSNADLRQDPTNYDLARSAIEWMSERGFVGPSPKEMSTYALVPGADLHSMIFGTLWTLLIAIIILGGGVWLSRRR